MSYHYSSSQYAKRRPYLTVMWIIFFLLLGNLLLFGYLYREKVNELFKPIATKAEYLKQWAQSHDKKKISKADKPISHKEKPVHFEFYSTLPTVEVKVPVKEENKSEKPVILQPFVASRDQLVKEFEEKIDETETQD